MEIETAIIQRVAGNIIIDKNGNITCVSEGTK